MTPDQYYARLNSADPKRVAHFSALRDRALSDAQMRPVSHAAERPDFSKIWSKNPWGITSFNLSTQMAVIRDNPKLAAALESEAARDAQAL